jgi:large subunit ribosomal protein L32
LIRALSALEEPLIWVGLGFSQRRPEHPFSMRRFESHPQIAQEIFMAVQQNKKSPSKRGMHRSHNAVAAPGTAIEPTTGEVHMRHHISPTGFYRGRKVLKTKADA